MFFFKDAYEDYKAMSTPDFKIAEKFIRTYGELVDFPIYQADVKKTEDEGKTYYVRFMTLARFKGYRLDKVSFFSRGKRENESLTIINSDNKAWHSGRVCNVVYFQTLLDAMVKVLPPIKIIKG